MNDENQAYEMPFETEDSYRIKIELGEMIPASQPKKEEWIPDDLLEEE
ncbi:hypothetical protein PP175_28915 (plasmid) [Aneurinibacillus sp. Ricciae_BoGa-3]|nr:hypothetical protein [Aneurinibacillus sp. Ricciae_BoGa-3]WCK57213.1 hypothetical protein PP175_28915 [Aneurinibacillus sp. Ricciae_BoGa-3]